MPLGNNKETLSPSKETEKIHLQNHKDLKEQGIIIPDGLKKDFDIKTTQEDIQNLKEELNTAGANQAEILKKFLWLEKEQTKVVAQETLKKFKKEEVASEEKEVNEEEKLEKEIETALENGDTNEEEAEKNSDKEVAETLKENGVPKEIADKVPGILSFLPASLKKPETVAGIATIGWGLITAFSLLKWLAWGFSVGGFLGTLGLGLWLAVWGITLASYIKYGNIKEFGKIIKNFWESTIKQIRESLHIEESEEQKQLREEKEKTLLYRENLEAFFSISPLNEPIVSTPWVTDTLWYVLKNWSLPSWDKNYVSIQTVRAKNPEQVRQTLLDPKIFSLSIEQLIKQKDNLESEFPHIWRTLYLLWEKQELLQLLTEKKGYDFKKMPLQELFLSISTPLADMSVIQNFAWLSNFSSLETADIYSGEGFLEARSSETPEFIDVYSLFKQTEVYNFEPFSGDKEALNKSMAELKSKHPSIQINNLSLEEKNALSVFYPLLINVTNEKREAKLNHLIKLISFGYNVQKSFEQTKMFNIVDTVHDFHISWENIAKASAPLPAMALWANPLDIYSSYKFDIRKIIKEVPLSSREVLKLQFITGGNAKFDTLLPTQKLHLYLFILSILKNRGKDGEAYGAYGSELINNLLAEVIHTDSAFPEDVKKLTKEMIDGKQYWSKGVSWISSWIAKWTWAAFQNPGKTTIWVAALVVAWKSRPIRRWSKKWDGTIN